LIHSDQTSDNRNQIVKEMTIGKGQKALGFQFPKFKDTPLSFCSFYCKGYEGSFGPTGIIFETDEPVIYVAPADSLEFMREGRYLPEYEQFVFKSIEDMLKKYPTSLDFKKDFLEYFKKLNPREVYPHKSPKDARDEHETDYVMWDRNWLNLTQNNEVTFKKPTKVKSIKIFNSKNELRAQCPL